MYLSVHQLKQLFSFMPYIKVIFTLDRKNIDDIIEINQDNRSKYRSISSNCLSILSSYFYNSSQEFLMTKVRVVTYTLVEETIYCYSSTL